MYVDSVEHLFMKKKKKKKTISFGSLGYLNMKKIQQQQKYYTKKVNLTTNCFVIEVVVVVVVVHLFIIIFFFFHLDFREQRLFQVHRHTNRAQQTKERATVNNSNNNNINQKKNNRDQVKKIQDTSLHYFFIFIFHGTFIYFILYRYVCTL